jgi:hypothetical protein
MEDNCLQILQENRFFNFHPYWAIWAILKYIADKRLILLDLVI